MGGLFSPPVDLLPMNVQDVDEILRIEYKIYSHPWSRANFTDSIASGYSCWVCRVGGELVGYYVVMVAVDDAHLLNISVSEKRQGLGFGARLLRHAMSVALQSGASTLLLEVRPSNVKAVELYRHFGFAQVGVRRGYYPADGGREDALVMTHPLVEVSA